MLEEKQISGEGFSPDILEFLRLLEKNEVRYVIVGGEAVIFYGYPRFTGDIDFFFARDMENIERLYQCLLDFWNGSIRAFYLVKAELLKTKPPAPGPRISTTSNT